VDVPCQSGIGLESSLDEEADRGTRAVVFPVRESPSFGNRFPRFSNSLQSIRL
jgi:hypothetical protein